MIVRVGKCLLQQRLKDSQISQKELAERVKTSSQMINHYVYNRKLMSLEMAKRVSVTLNCKIDDLYEWDFESE